MFYNLRIWALGFGPGIEITATEYKSLVAAVERIYVATGIEEKLDILLENYAEYERELLHLALESSLFRSPVDHRLFREVQVMNRRVVNLLTAARLYVDQVKHAVSIYFTESPAPDIAALFSAEYDKHLEYRIAEALRNYTQHRELPVHQMSWPHQWEEMDTPQKRMRSWVVPSVLVDELATQDKFKAAVLAELQSDEKKSLSLTPILRQYVESLASVHDQLRLALASQCESDHQTLSAALDRARAEFGEALVALAASAGDDPDKPSEHHYISARSWKRREALIQKNSRLRNLSRRYVSTEYPSDAV